MHAHLMGGSGYQPTVLAHVGDRRLHAEVTTDHFVQLDSRYFAGHRPCVEHLREAVKLDAVCFGEVHRFGQAGDQGDQVQVHRQFHAQCGLHCTAAHRLPAHRCNQWGGCREVDIGTGQQDHQLRRFGLHA